MDPFPPSVVALNEQTLPSVSSFTPSVTSTEVILANHGACATPCFRVRSLRPCLSETLGTDAAKCYKRVANATALIWKVLMIAQSRFRRLDAPELLTEVYHRVTYVNGHRASLERKRRAAA